MSFASITASGIISEPKVKFVPTKVGEQKVMNFNLYVVPKNKNNGLNEENMVFACSVWNNQADSFEKLLTKGREITLQGNFEVVRFTTKNGEVVEQNRIDFANIVGLGNTSEDREIIKEVKGKYNKPVSKTAKA
jgi:single-stranded DNA-binding protein